MSGFKYNKNINRLIVFFLLLYAFGDLLACLFIRFASTDLLSKILTDPGQIFFYPNLSSVLSVALKEYAAVFLIYIFSFLPYGKIFSYILIVYKGFCLGTISSILCFNSGLRGIFQILILVLPPNLIYLLSLLIAVQQYFAFERRSLKNKLEKKYKIITILLSFFITSIGLIFDLWVTPLIFNILWKG